MVRGMIAHAQSLPNVRRRSTMPTVSVTATPPPLSGPVLIGDVATPAGGVTLLALLLRTTDPDVDE